MSVVLLCLAFPPVNASLLALIALAPWMSYIRDCGPKEARRSGYLFGFLYFLFQMFWLVPFVSRWTGGVLLAMVPWILAALIAGIYFMFAGWGVNRCWMVGAWWAVPLVWSGIEAFRSYVYQLAFPWGLVAFPLWRFPAVAQSASLGTVFLVSSLVVLLNVALACWVWPSADSSRRPSRRALAVGVTFVVASVGFSVWRYSRPQEGEPHRYLVAQPGVDHAFGDAATRPARMERAVKALIGRAVAEGARTVVFPEGVTGPSSQLPPPGPIRPMGGLELIFGGNHTVGKDTYQSAYAFDGEWKIADKTRLVIFGEYVPLRGHLPFLDNFEVPAGDLIPAQSLTTLDVGGVRTGAMLCFEGVFPDLSARHGTNGAQVLTVMAIDDWYVGTPAHEQLMGSSVWRSIESGLPLLRSASTGTSLVTDSRGRVVLKAKEGGLAGIVADVDVPPKQDGFAYRFVFVWACWLTVLFVAVPRRLTP